MGGEEGLKGGAQGFQGGQGFHFNPSNAEDIFRSFFGDAFGGGRGGHTTFSFGGGGRPGRSGFGGMGGMGGMQFGDFDDMGGFGGSSQPRKDPPCTITMPLTLEELYTGCTKKNITRQIIDSASGKPVQVSQVIEINVKPGWKTGTKITYAGMGNERPGSEPGDLIFVIQETPHPQFKREKNDLIVTTDVSLKEALCGTSVMVNTLSGRRLRVNVRDIITPNYTKRVAGEGMPLPRNPSQKGDIVLKFNVRWPTHLSDEQKQQLANLL